MDPRRAGLLVHPTSLTGPSGIGDLGFDAVRFLDWSAEAGQTLWQFLPLSPVGDGYSPYSALSAFAGNPLLISTERLKDEDWIDRGAIESPPSFPRNRVDFPRVEAWKHRQLQHSWSAFRRHAPAGSMRAFEAFVEDLGRADWLEDWALYSALRRHFGRSPWWDWPRELKLRRRPALRSAGRELADEVGFQRYLQFLFHEQWRALRADARRRGIRLMGDLPFYAAHDSADVWAHPELFQLDDEGRPLKVAGVPPDYFSETGQLWGNPVYRWDRIAQDGYRWWITRLRANLERVDLLRLDHFRAFEAYWEVDASARTAAGGRWVRGPGQELFDALKRALGPLSLVAEDLGVITDEVHALRRELGLPGMRVLQFAFDDDESEHLPTRLDPNTVAYTGTHDNDTMRGWFDSLEGARRERVLDHLHADDTTVVWHAIEAIYDSQAGAVVTPLQDVFDLGGAARMNRPGMARGNWGWRAEPELFTLDLAARLRRLAERTGRLPGPVPPSALG